ncbi:secretin and TonB N-terminal domain-containing protein [Acinetobacter sp. ANC 4805]|uniref:secretin and TonB N-terminal domain-containing protein n=1 Tax=Acinetobacter sp. ANC 4805 TaxID=2923425 RepID=UPI001F4B7DB6|nr:secretin and TonB N-terminal domain-containing protein [Acinetobacter sp. ANC 4805]MCH7311205.1 hypothetical protein [Acinetobacter sp. ANC 4805]
MMMKKYYLCATLFWGTVIYSSVALANEDLASSQPSLLDKKISLNFREANVRQVMDVVSQTAGINFIFDSDVGKDLKTTIYASNAKISETLDLILKTNKLRYKVVNQNTYLIFNDTADKTQQYEDLQIKTFVLKAGDPKKTQDVLKTILNPKFIYIDDKNRLITLRDRPEILQAAEKLIQVYDQPDPEVVLEVKVFEVSNEILNNLGIAIPSKVSLSPIGISAQSSSVVLNDLLNLSKDRMTVGGVSPLVTLNLQDTNGRVNLLARPSLRVKNLEKAKIVVGDKVPVITSTMNQVSSSVTESVSYLDVGLTLEVQPEIQVNDEVGIKVSLEVSNIVKEIRTNTGLLTYQIGTRNANTVLQLKDGETEVLAGLIREQERKSSTNIPFLGRLPVLGPLFSSRSKDKSRSEILLSITPKIIRRNTERLNYTNAFDSGTQNYISLNNNQNSLAQFKGEISGSSSDNPPPSAYIPVPPPQPVAQPQSTSENIINLNVPEQIISTDPLNVLVEAQSIAKGSKVLIKFDRHAFNLSDVRLMTKASQSVTYNTTLEGIEIVVNDDLKQQSLALLILQPLPGYKGKGEITLASSHDQFGHRTDRKTVEVK